MDFNIDSPFTMVVLIVLISVGAGVVNNWLKTRNQSRTDTELLDKIARMEADMDRMADRIRTLERLATDPEQRLRDDFSRLA